MPVNSTHPEYAANIDSWTLVRDCDAGSGAVKARAAKSAGDTLDGLKGTAYLPAPNASDTSSENKSRYQSYLKRANYVNFTGYAREGLTGMVFRKPTEIAFPPDIAYMADNANGGGMSADQMVKGVLSDVLLTGRYGLLADYPAAPPGLTQAEVTALGLQSSLQQYPAESIINWRTTVVDGITKLSMVVLRELVESVDEDGFAGATVVHHRVLRLEDGIYFQNVYDEKDQMLVYETGEIDADGKPVVSGNFILTKFDGSTWDEIPFAFIGSVNNDHVVDKSPLYDIANVNIAHYQNSADYEESSFFVGQPTLTLSGLTQGWVDTNMSDGISLGSRGSITLPVGGDSKLLQADPNQMPLRGMEVKESQMVMIGTRLIQDNGGVETAEAARIRFAGQNSKLGSITGNVEAGFVKAFGWSSEFMGGVSETVVNINREFYDATLDAQTIMAQIQLMDRGVITKNDIRDTLRKSNQLDDRRTDEEIDGEAEIVSPIGMA